MTDDAEANARPGACRPGLRILQQCLQNARRTRDALWLGARRPESQGALPPSKFSEAELMQ